MVGSSNFAASRFLQRFELMPEYYAIKRKNAWFWKTQFTLEEIRARYEKNLLDRDWLLCPLGQAEKSVTVGQYLHNPTIFEQQQVAEVQQERLKANVRDSIPEPALIIWGKRMIQAFACCMILGRVLVPAFLPDRQGKGLDAVALSILIPIWTLGGLGLLFWILGKVQHSMLIRRAQKKIDPQLPQAELVDSNTAR